MSHLRKQESRLLIPSFLPLTRLTRLCFAGAGLSTARGEASTSFGSNVTLSVAGCPVLRMPKWQPTNPMSLLASAEGLWAHKKTPPER